MADDDDHIQPDPTAPGADGRSRLMQEVAAQIATSKEKNPELAWRKLRADSSR